MCDYCSSVLDGLCSSHTVITCPYRKSMYCYVCVSYGHCVKECPNKRAKAIRDGKPLKGVQNLVLEIPNKQEFLLEKGYIETKSTYVPDAKANAFIKDYAYSMKPPRMPVFV